MQEARSDEKQPDANLGPIRCSGSDVGHGPPTATWLLEHGGSIEQIGSYVGQGRPIATPDLARWLLEHGRSIERIASFVDELCWRAMALGLPLWRVTLHTATLHPQLAGLGCRWWRDRNLTEEFTIVLGAEESADFLSSPIRDSVLHGTVARFRLAQGHGRDYALLEQIREGGGTDFLALPLFRLFDHHPVTTWVTDAPGGFTDDQVVRLAALVPALGAVVEARLQHRIARDLLRTYLGRQAGLRVLAGQIRRGRGERVRAVIMASDLQGSTALSDHLPAEEMIELLDSYFEHVAEPVQAHGGDVLKFLGRRGAGDLSGRRVGRGSSGGCRPSGRDRDAGPPCRALPHAGTAAACPAPCRYRAAPGRRVLRQCRCSEPSRFHGHRPGGQPRLPHREHNQGAGPSAADLAGVRPCGPDAAALLGCSSAARHHRARGTVRPALSC